ncbi:outer membrane lipoprotein carrier protein LolA [Shewanella fidelis]|uniref:Outer membrane lipoprotein carrier protein LolA n=1 Tax=Shewanella fidelis TaxID=173509 RepID=A0AAW8NRX1_9GAMM|nr:outer membrane lipoprotein carrier protein LolA [Shewanella fidelis]MDR8525507.1 outer membrane lipoprotein carrier protein LolA [Shewanella fidelis]MDW4813174.1 outer membrane lipoprotein carrier protein LolA [Shewanella fidelis]MDW4816946.1 outer membrane lipoprotein carrier protein LolA [Shewanella fidelis]MDW4820105.1 outer membrane lipoprotein carrier protein LolA [Shewanella fidelis]MDW4825639.1 outer membrane lipoprotein carrier protein LolA [Shewanella fidelis]
MIRSLLFTILSCSLLVSCLFITTLLTPSHAEGAVSPNEVTFDYQKLFAKPATDAELLALSQSLSPSPQAKGEFTQSRYLKVLKKPLISSGEFLFANNIGVIWQQSKPFSSTLILKDKKLIQIDSNGKINVNHAQQAGANMMSDIMPTLLNALLSGDINALKQHFELSLLMPSTDKQSAPSQQASAQWQLGLKPLDAMVQKAMPQLVLSGKQQIHSLVLFSGNGDRSQITFTAVDESPLSSSDIARFSPEVN